MEYRVGFEYEGDRLVGTNQSTHEVGRADDSFLGGATNYDWPGGNCRPTKISIKNKLLLGSASGVLFDARLCEALKKKGLDPSRGGACVADAQATFKVMQEFDSELRSATKETEVLVGGQPLLPGGLVLIGKTADTGYALQLMASCAEFARAGSISKSAKPADNFSDGTPKKGQSAK